MSRTQAPPSGKSSTWASFLIAMGFALAISSGALLATIATEGVEGLTNATGAGRAALARQQLQQGHTIAALEKAISGLTTDLDYLGDRVETVAKRAGTERGDRLARLDAEVAALEGELAAVQGRAADPATLDGYPVATRTDVLDLRASIDALAATRRRDLATINRRLDRLETMVRSDVTSSVPHPSIRRRPEGKVTPPAAKEQVPDFVREADTYVATRPTAPDQGHIFDLLIPRKPEAPAKGPAPRGM